MSPRSRRWTARSLAPACRHARCAPGL